MRGRRSRCASIAALATLAALAVAAPAGAVSLAPIGSYDSPMFITSDPGNPDRLLVAEREGRVMLTSGGTTTTFLNIRDRVDTDNERGLLSLAPAADFDSTGHFFVDYASDDELLHVDEYTASGNSAPESTRRPILSIPHPGEGNHNGGQLQFGPDGYLYVSTGDGGGGDDPNNNAQNTGSLLGKLLRIDPKPGATLPYTIPPDNPFAGGIAGADEIWSLGLRNPWRFSFDRSSGALVIADVGQGAREEIDYEPQPDAGRRLNFGWDCREGTIAHTVDPSPICASEPPGAFTSPVFDYDHSRGCAIVGGYVVRDPALSDVEGRYLYSDNCASDIRSIQLALGSASGDRSEALDVSGPSSFGEDSCGRIYVASLASNEVSRLVGATPTDCSRPSDRQPPDLKLGGARKQRIGHSRRIQLRITSDESAELVVSGEVDQGAGKRRLFGLEARHRELQGAVETRLSWRLSKHQARRARRLIGRGRQISARFTFTATDQSGNSTGPQTESFRLVRN